jgi:hypothetical protein
MEETDIWAILERGGAKVLVEETEDGSIIGSMSRYEPLGDPEGTRALADLIAKKAEAHSPNVVLVWEDLEDAVLGFAVAEQMRLPAVRIYEQEGLAHFNGELPDIPKAVFVADAVRDTRSLEAGVALLEKNGGVLLAAIPIVEVGPTVASVPVEPLIRIGTPRTMEPDRGG